MLYSVQETCTRIILYKKPCQTVKFLVQVDLYKFLDCVSPPLVQFRRTFRSNNSAEGFGLARQRCAIHRSSCTYSVPHYNYSHIVLVQLQYITFSAFILFSICSLAFNLAPIKIRTGYHYTPCLKKTVPVLFFE